MIQDIKRSDLWGAIAQLYSSEPTLSLGTEVDPQTALTQLIQATTHEETRWQAAELLWTLDPNHPATGIRRVMDLGVQFSGHAFAFLVAVLRTHPERVSILLRLYPVGAQGYLPEGLELAVLDTAGTVGYIVKARDRDNYIQSKCCATEGERFSVRLTLGEESITEYFIA
jgi:Protein of unknown function (DUF1822)